MVSTAWVCHSSWRVSEAPPGHGACAAWHRDVTLHPYMPARERRAWQFRANLSAMPAGDCHVLQRLGGWPPVTAGDRPPSHDSLRAHNHGLPHRLSCPSYGPANTTTRTPPAQKCALHAGIATTHVCTHTHAHACKNAASNCPAHGMARQPQQAGRVSQSTAAAAAGSNTQHRGWCCKRWTVTLRCTRRGIRTTKARKPCHITAMAPRIGSSGGS